MMNSSEMPEMMKANLAGEMEMPTEENNEHSERFDVV